MACTKCGGTVRRQIAPGFYECQTVISEMGYVPVPAPGHTPVQWTAGPVDRVCGHRYQEGAPITAGASKCECGVYAIAECSGCGIPLCGDHLRRFEGRVYCAADLRQLQAAQKATKHEQQVNRFLAELDDLLGQISDPVERLLCLHTSIQWARDQVLWRPQLLTVIEGTLRKPHPFFKIDHETPRIEVGSPEAFTSWVFRHPRAKIETLRIKEWSRFTRHRHTVASADVVRIVADRRDTSDRDSQYSSIIPGLVLLSNGVFCSSSIYDKEALRKLSAQSPSSIAGDNLAHVAWALGIPAAFVRS